MGLIVHDAKREEGFTLIELLVVVIIIGILAAIAIPVFLNQRERAWRSAVDSDLRNAGIAMETYFTDNGSYPGAGQTALLDGLGFTNSQGVTVAIVAPLTSAEFCLTGSHTNLPNNPAAIYQGGNVTSGVSGVQRGANGAAINCPT